MNTGSKLILIFPGGSFFDADSAIAPLQAVEMCSGSDVSEIHTL